MKLGLLNNIENSQPSQNCNFQTATRVESKSSPIHKQCSMYYLQIVFVFVVGSICSFYMKLFHIAFIIS